MNAGTTHTKQQERVASVLPRLLGEMRRDQFLAEHWGQRPLHVSGADRRHWPGALFSRQRLDEILLTRAVKVKAAYRDLSGQHAEMRVDARQARQYFDAGMTLCVEQVHLHEEALGRLLAACKLELGAAGFVLINCYDSPPGKGFGLHFDYVHVFILQVEGEKQWRISDRPAVPWPRENLIARDRDRWNRDNPAQSVPPPDAGTFTELRLSPGDVLYLPPGTWHEASAEGASLGLTLSFRPLLFAEYVARRLEQHLAAQPRWRSDAPPLSAPGGASGGPDAIGAFWQEQMQCLKEGLDALTVEDFHRHVLEENARIPVLPVLLDPAADGPVRSYARATPYPVRIAKAVDPDERLLFYAHQRVRLPVRVAALAERLCAAPVFDRGQARAWGAEHSLEPDEVEDLLRLLVRLGIVHCP